MTYEVALDKTVAATTLINNAMQDLIQGADNSYSKTIREALSALDDALAVVEDDKKENHPQAKEPTMLEYISDIPVEGHDTVLGYLAKTQSETLEIMGEPVMQTRHDDFWLLSRCRTRGIEPIEVDAPEAMRFLGFPKTYAYPIELLVERLED